MKRIPKLRRFLISLIIIVIHISTLLASNRNPSSKNDVKPLVIKLATLAPSGSPWHEILKDMAAQVSEASAGKVALRIYPGGVAGDEADVVRKMRIGQLHAAAITNGGLSRIAAEVNVLTIPMAVDSWESLERVRAAMASRLEALFKEKGFVILNWGDAGWVRFFVPQENASLQSVQQAKLFVWSGDDRTVDIWKSAGFKVVPLAATDMLPALQTGMIDAFNTTPIMALASQWFPFTKCMIDMPWAPLIGATVISLDAWNKIPAEIQPKIKAIAEAVGAEMTAEIKRLENDAIVEMEKRGLKIIRPTPEQIANWRAAMQTTYPKIRGVIIPERWFDDALKAAANETITNGH